MRESTDDDPDRGCIVNREYYYAVPISKDAYGKSAKQPRWAEGARATPKRRRMTGKDGRTKDGSAGMDEVEGKWKKKRRMKGAYKSENFVIGVNVIKDPLSRRSSSCLVSFFSRKKNTEYRLVWIDKKKNKTEKMIDLGDIVRTSRYIISSNAYVKLYVRIPRYSISDMYGEENEISQKKKLSMKELVFFFFFAIENAYCWKIENLTTHERRRKVIWDNFSIFFCVPPFPCCGERRERSRQIFRWLSRVNWIVNVEWGGVKGERSSGQIIYLHVRRPSTVRDSI